MSDNTITSKSSAATTHTYTSSANVEVQADANFQHRFILDGTQNTNATKVPTHHENCHRTRKWNKSQSVNLNAASKSDKFQAFKQQGQICPELLVYCHAVSMPSMQGFLESIYM
jgi:hypothetical protein